MLKGINFLLFILLYFPITMSSYTRTDGLPQGFKWRYVMDIREPVARYGEFWRDGIFLGDKIIVLNTHSLVALDLEGNEIWKYGLQQENVFAHAKILKITSNEIAVIITGAILRINADNGQLLNHYGYDTKKRSAFQFTELLPRTAILFDEYIYVFLGPELLAFHKETLRKTEVYNFNSSPKTLPILYQDKFIIGFLNGFVEIFDPTTKTKSTLFHGDKNEFFSVRQPVIIDDLIYIPTTHGIYIYKDLHLYTKNTQLFDNILSDIDGTIWLRQHEKGSLTRIDETLSPLEKIQFISDRLANKISTHLVGNSDTILQTDSFEGTIFVIGDGKVQKVIYAEDFADSAPLQIITQHENKVLLGGFDGLYLIDLNQM